MLKIDDLQKEADESHTGTTSPAGNGFRIRKTDNECQTKVRWGKRCGSGARRDRTADLLNAIQALSQLSYSPTKSNMLSNNFLLLPSFEGFDIVSK